MHNIHWSPLAKEDYWANIDYLLDEWTVKDVTNFIAKVDEYLSIISKNPKTFSATKYRNTHIVPIVPQITLFYRINNKNIELLRFWNNLKNPSNLQL
jgi:plasmid stabilization system protein ParE